MYRFSIKSRLRFASARVLWEGKNRSVSYVCKDRIGSVNPVLVEIELISVTRGKNTPYHPDILGSVFLQFTTCVTVAVRYGVIVNEALCLCSGGVCGFHC